MSDKVIIKIDHRTPNAYLAAQRLQQFLRQFDKMTEEQKQACIEKLLVCFRDCMMH